MSQLLLPAIAIQALAPLSEENFSELFSHLDSQGITHAFEQREPTPYATLEWLVPTGIVLFITHSYFDGIFKEMGKDHYTWFKGALSSLYKKAFGEKPEVKFTVVSAGKPKVPSYFSGTLSFFYVNSLGYRVKLLFPLDITVDDYSVSCEEFVKLITAHEKGLSDDVLGVEIEFQTKVKVALTGNVIPTEHIRSTVILLIFWNRHNQCFHVVDAALSGREGQLVSKELGSPRRYD